MERRLNGRDGRGANLGANWSNRAMIPCRSQFSAGVWGIAGPRESRKCGAAIQMGLRSNAALPSSNFLGTFIRIDASDPCGRTIQYVTNFQPDAAQTVRFLEKAGASFNQ